MERGPESISFLLLISSKLGFGQPGFQILF